jgi:hypothetical protein
MRHVSGSLFAEFAARAGLPGDASLGEVVAAVHAIPYARPTSRTPDGVLAEWKGTCSTKHALLARIVAERWPQLRPRLIHRVYRADRAFVLSRYGAVAAGAVPDGGLTDVHRYLLLAYGGQDVIIDVTFPGDPPWDGHSSMPLACGDGQDFPAGDDPAAEKAALEASYCDPQVREPFIAALSRQLQPGDAGRPVLLQRLCDLVVPDGGLAVDEVAVIVGVEDGDADVVAREALDVGPR